MSISARMNQNAESMSDDDEYDEDDEGGCRGDSRPSCTTIILQSPSASLGKLMALGEALLCCLRSCSLPYNLLGQDGATKFGDVLNRMPCLTYLDLSFNNIPDAGIAALSKGLQCHPALQLCNFTGNLISDVGAADLASVIASKPPFLEFVNLSVNNVQDDGARSLAKSIEVNPELTTLALRGNPVSTDARRCVELAIRDNRVTRRKNGHWLTLAPLIASGRANRDSPLLNSIHDLLPIIVQFARSNPHDQYYDAGFGSLVTLDAPTQRLNSQSFMETSFYKQQTGPQWRLPPPIPSSPSLSSLINSLTVTIPLKQAQKHLYARVQAPKGLPSPLMVDMTSTSDSDYTGESQAVQPQGTFRFSSSEKKENEVDWAAAKSPTFLAISFPAPEFKLQRSMPQQQQIEQWNSLLQSQMHNAKTQHPILLTGDFNAVQPYTVRELPEIKSGKKAQKRKFEGTAADSEDGAPCAQQLQHDEQKHGNGNGSATATATAYDLGLCHGGANSSPMRTESDEAEREADRRFWEEVTCSHRAKRQKIAASGFRYGIPCVSATQPCPSGQVYQPSVQGQGQMQGQGQRTEMDSRGDGIGAEVQGELSDSFELDSEADDLLGPPWLRQVRVW